MGKSKVHHFQICCAKTKYPSEIQQRWTIIVRAAIDNRAVNSVLLSMLEFNNYCVKFRFLLNNCVKFRL